MLRWTQFRVLELKIPVFEFINHNTDYNDSTKRGLFFFLFKQVVFYTTLAVSSNDTVIIIRINFYVSISDCKYIKNRLMRNQYDKKVYEKSFVLQ